MLFEGQDGLGWLMAVLRAHTSTQTRGRACGARFESKDSKAKLLAFEAFPHAPDLDQDKPYEHNHDSSVDVKERISPH